MKSGGRKVDVGGVVPHVPDYKYGAIYLRASFLPVKRSTHGLVNSGVFPGGRTLDNEVYLFNIHK